MHCSATWAPSLVHGANLQRVTSLHLTTNKSDGKERVGAFWSISSDLVRIRILLILRCLLLLSLCFYQRTASSSLSPGGLASGFSPVLCSPSWIPSSWMVFLLLTLSRTNRFSCSPLIRWDMVVCSHGATHSRYALTGGGLSARLQMPFGRLCCERALALVKLPECGWLMVNEQTQKCVWCQRWRPRMQKQIMALFVLPVKCTFLSRTNHTCVRLQAYSDKHKYVTLITQHLQPIKWWQLSNYLIGLMHNVSKNCVCIVCMMQKISYTLPL